MRNKKYWIDRAERRMDGYVASAFDEARVIGRTYRSLKTYITTEMAKILRHVGDEDTLAYEYRMKRLNALLLNAEQKYKELYGINLNSATEFLKSIIPEAYYHTIFDIAQGFGVQPEFATVPTKLVNKIINEDWSGRNYSKRIWANTEDLAEELREVMTEAAVTGESIGKTSRKIAEKFDTSEYNARRLIRTETTYTCNQAELGAYKELDIDRYMYVATYAEETCEVCQKNNNKVYERNKAKAGVNLPPMHPNCRCTTIAYFDEGMPTVRLARDKDGKNIQIPANMSYDQWKEKYITPYKHDKGTTKPTSKTNTITPAKPVDVVVSDSDKRQGGYKDVPIDKPKRNGIIEDKLYPDKLANVKRGKKMSYEEADSGNVNPNYGEKGYDTNCQCCTIVNEARRRGYNVEALPNTAGSMAQRLENHYTDAWIDPKTGKRPEFLVDRTKNSPKKYLEFMKDKMKQGERYALGFTWKGKGNSGHIVNLDLTDAGEIRIKDNQRGKKERSEWIGDKAVTKYLKQMKWSETVSGYKMAKVPKMLRVDNLQFEPDVAKKIMREHVT